MSGAITNLLHSCLAFYAYMTILRDPSHDLSHKYIYQIDFTNTDEVSTFLMLWIFMSTTYNGVCGLVHALYTRSGYGEGIGNNDYIVETGLTATKSVFFTQQLIGACILFAINLGFPLGEKFGSTVVSCLLAESYLAAVWFFLSRSLPSPPSCTMIAQTIWLTRFVRSLLTPTLASFYDVCTGIAPTLASNPPKDITLRTGNTTTGEKALALTIHFGSSVAGSVGSGIEIIWVVDDFYARIIPSTIFNHTFEHEGGDEPRMAGDKVVFHVPLTASDPNLESTTQDVIRIVKQLSFFETPASTRHGGRPGVRSTRGIDFSSAPFTFRYGKGSGQPIDFHSDISVHARIHVSLISPSRRRLAILYNKFIELGRRGLGDIVEYAAVFNSRERNFAMRYFYTSLDLVFVHRINTDGIPRSGEIWSIDDFYLYGKLFTGQLDFAPEIRRVDASAYYAAESREIRAAFSEMETQTDLSKLKYAYNSRGGCVNVCRTRPRIQVSSRGVSTVGHKRRALDTFMDTPSHANHFSQTECEGASGHYDVRNTPTIRTVFKNSPNMADHELNLATRIGNLGTFMQDFSLPSRTYQPGPVVGLVIASSKSNSSPQSHDDNTVTAVPPKTDNTVTAVPPKTDNTVTAVLPETDNSVTAVPPKTDNTVTAVPPKTDNTVTAVPPEADNTVTAVMDIDDGEMVEVEN
jgi:hypothetical protein